MRNLMVFGVLLLIVSCDKRDYRNRLEGAYDVYVEYSGWTATSTDSAALVAQHDTVYRTCATVIKNPQYEEFIEVVLSTGKRFQFFVNSDGVLSNGTGYENIKGNISRKKISIDYVFTSHTYGFEYLIEGTR